MASVPAFLGALALATSPIPLPKPVGPIPVIASVFKDRPDRLKGSSVPGPVDDTERVRVLLDPAGRPAQVTLTQRLDLSGTGQFIVREHSSAQDVEALDDTVAPVLKREAVVWQGFVSGRKTLRAILTLDPAVEAPLLPLAVTLEWQGAGTVGPGGRLPGPGRLTVRLHNATGRPLALPVGTATDPAALAPPLDALLRHATSRSSGTPPAAGRGLPLTVPGTLTGTRDVTSVAPLRVTGTITATGATGAGLGTKPVPDGIRLNGVLQGDGEFTLTVPATAQLRLDLTAVPTLDPRLLQPPRGRTWAEWARLSPTPNEISDALTMLIEGAAAAARDDEYAPYLGHHGPGRVDTTFAFAMAPPSVVKIGPKALRPKGFPIALAVVALLGVVGNAGALWRRL